MTPEVPLGSLPQFLTKGRFEGLEMYWFRKVEHPAATSWPIVKELKS
jgi:hypothetical protein